MRWRCEVNVPLVVGYKLQYLPTYTTCLMGSTFRMIEGTTEDDRCPTSSVLVPPEKMSGNNAIQLYTKTGECYAENIEILCK